MDETSQGRMNSQAGDSPPGGGRGLNPRCISPLASTSSPPPALLPSVQWFQRLRRLSSLPLLDRAVEAVLLGWEPTPPSVLP